MSTGEPAAYLGSGERSRGYAWLTGAALLGLAVVALSRPNAAKPDLRSGWPLDGLLPLALSPAWVTGVLWAAYAVGAVAVFVGLRRPLRPLGWGMPLALAAVALVAAPLGSADHLNYAAYGRILIGGGNPWTASPIAWAGGTDPITSAVEAPWTTTPSVYGPFVTLLHAAGAAMGGSHLRLVVLGWQVFVVLAWLGVRAALRGLLGPAQHGRIDVLWTLNPLVVATALLGAHVDTVAVAFVVAAAAALTRWPTRRGVVVAGVCAALATGTKFTYAVIGVAILLTWFVIEPRVGGLQQRLSWRAGRARVGWLLAGAVPTLVVLYAGAGLDALLQPFRAGSSVSLATPWRLVLRALSAPLGNTVTRTLIMVGSAALAITLAVLFLRLLRPAGSPPASTGALVLVTTAGLGAAYSLSAGYTLPWYDLLAWAALPAVAPGLLDLVLLARLTIIAAAYVPGRVLGSTPAVDAVTLGYRREVAPWLQLALWVVTLVTASRAVRAAGDDRAAPGLGRGPRPPGP